jgi:hypothetical protein
LGAPALFRFRFALALHSFIRLRFGFAFIGCFCFRFALLLYSLSVVLPLSVFAFVGCFCFRLVTECARASFRFCFRFALFSFRLCFRFFLSSTNPPYHICVLLVTNPPLIIYTRATGVILHEVTTGTLSSRRNDHMICLYMSLTHPIIYVCYRRDPPLTNPILDMCYRRDPILIHPIIYTHTRIYSCIRVLLGWFAGVILYELKH